jgi:two-component system response regulator
VRPDKLPTVLLIDDDPNDEELARIALEATAIPHQLVVRRDGAEALAWLRDLELNEALPCLILLDLKLPKITGLEVLEQLRQGARTKVLPVIVFTSSSELRDLRRSYDLGANAYIRKPVDFSQYRQTVADLGRFWILRNNPPPPQSLGETA